MALETTKDAKTILDDSFGTVRKRMEKGQDVCTVFCIGSFVREHVDKPVVQFGLSDKNVAWLKGNIEVKSYSSKAKKEYSRYLPVSAFGDVANRLAGAREGDKVFIVGRLAREEYNGRWYDKVVAYDGAFLSRNDESQDDMEEQVEEQRQETIPF